MKKRLVLALVLSFALLATTACSSTLTGIKSSFTNQIAAVESLTVIETKSAMGKLFGNGNGVNFFVATLVKMEGETANEDLEELVEALDEKFDVVEWRVQTDQEIVSMYLEHQDLSFDHKDFTDGTYVCISIYVSQTAWGNFLNDHTPIGH